MQAQKSKNFMLFFRNTPGSFRLAFFPLTKKRVRGWSFFPPFPAKPPHQAGISGSGCGLAALVTSDNGHSRHDAAPIPPHIAT